MLSLDLDNNNNIILPFPRADANMATFKLPEHGEVADIGGSSMMSDVELRLRNLFPKLEEGEEKQKVTLPDELLYTDLGLAIWNEIIFTPEFYQTHDEIAIFDHHGDEVVEACEDGVVLIDLGAGSVYDATYQVCPIH